MIFGKFTREFVITRHCEGETPKQSTTHAVRFGREFALKKRDLNAQWITSLRLQ